MPEPEPNSAGQVETADELDQTPNVGGDLPDPEQNPTLDSDADAAEAVDADADTAAVDADAVDDVDGQAQL